MTLVAEHEPLLDRLDDDLRAALQPSARLFAKLIGGACTRLPMLGGSTRAQQLTRLIEAEAWIECAVALVELEVPAFTLRRLVAVGGEWLCTLSRHPNLPIEFDDTAEARHESPALAIARALVEAKRRQVVSRPSLVPRLTPQASSSATGDTIYWGNLCCENYA